MTELLTWIAAFVTGLLASMGVGGGMILIIWYTAVLGADQLEAQGINLLFFLPIALLSVIMHRKNGLIDIKTMLPAMLTGAAGAAAGSLAAQYIGSDILKKIFALFILFIGIKEIAAALKANRS
ncbi:MAG: sulfite exporter TauE/SafE family protein [Ruminococcus sp.]|nr:sulfite exporter TauE/SafE family protein [Ruminococcus sp.]